MARCECGHDRRSHATMQRAVELPEWGDKKWVARVAGACCHMRPPCACRRFRCVVSMACTDARCLRFGRKCLEHGQRVVVR